MVFPLLCFHTQNVQNSVLCIIYLCFQLPLSWESQFSYKQKGYWITEKQAILKYKLSRYKFCVHVFVTSMSVCLCSIVCVRPEDNLQDLVVFFYLILPPVQRLELMLSGLSKNTLICWAIFLAPYKFPNSPIIIIWPFRVSQTVMSLMHYLI